MVMIRQALEERRMSFTQVFEWKSSNSPKPKKARQVKSKVKSILIIFFDIKVIVHRDFIDCIKVSD
jgi:hypothetical protein